MHISNLITLSISLLALINPVGVCAMYLSLTKTATPSQVRSIPIKFFIATIIIALISIWIGNLFLHLFGISLPNFQLAGGIVLLILGLNMIFPKTTQESIHKSVDTTKTNLASIAFVPLAIPMGAGPGVIAILIESSNRYHSIIDKISLSAVSITICFVCTLAVYFAPTIGRKMGTTGIKTMSRIIGLIIAAIGSGMLGRAISGMFPILH